MRQFGAVHVSFLFVIVLIKINATFILTDIACFKWFISSVTIFFSFMKVT
jgi:hypothetical protein